MVNANSVKFLKKGNMPTKKLELPNSLGYIKPTKKTISTEDHTNFQIFDCLQKIKIIRLDTMMRQMVNILIWIDIKESLISISFIILPEIC